MFSRLWVGFETIGLNTMPQTKELPTSVAQLNSSLTDVNGNDLLHEINILELRLSILKMLFYLFLVWQRIYS